MCRKASTKVDDLLPHEMRRLKQLGDQNLHGSPQTCWSRRRVKIQAHMRRAYAARRAPDAARRVMLPS